LFSLSVRAADDNKADWMNSSLSGLATLFQSCLEVPQFNNFVQGNISLDISQDTWKSTGSYVQKDKAIKFDWSSKGVTARPRKYLVIYRIDPRFDKPQIYIKTFNYLTNKYEVTYFPKFTTTDPNKDYVALAFLKMSDYVNYFNFAGGRKKIRVEKGDVINITLAKSGDFLGVATGEDLLTSELDNTRLGIPSLYTSSNLDNKIIYSSAEKLCDSIDQSRSKECSGNGTSTRFKTVDNLILVGKPLSESLIEGMGNIGVTACPDNSTGRDNPICFYDQGRGMKLLVNGQIIKREPDSFVYSAILGKSFLYYKSDVAGNLDFLTDWSIQGMFQMINKPLMSDWSGFSNLAALESYFNDPSGVNLKASFLHFGRYIMIVEVGNGDKTVSFDQQKAIEVEYIIKPGSSAPLASDSGIKVSQEFTTNADKDGFLWVRVKNPNQEVIGAVRVNYANYTGTTWFSDIVYNEAVKPIINQFHKLTMDFYTKLTKNATLQRIAKLCLILYVMIYALTFLAGATQITAKDLITRLFKITLIVVLIGEDSWNFFNNYLFKAFIEGTDYIITNAIGITSSKGNIFGFIDPIFDKYTQGPFWRLLFIELLQIHNGLAFVAIVTIYSICIYFRAILEVIIGYVMAYVSLSIMISLAPFFIILMLFEKTKTIFDNWLSTLFNYMIQPTILLIFFLLIDQIMSEQLLKIVVRACWGDLIPIALGLDLTHMDIPINFSITLPFLKAIPFFIPSVTDIDTVDALLNSTGTFLVVFTSALLFYAYSKMAQGLVGYVSIVVAQLTNVTPARQEGNFQAPSNPTDSIMQDLRGVAAPFKDAALAPARIFKDKIIDQNYRARGAEDNKKEYTGKIFASRNDGDNGPSNKATLLTRKNRL
jgi:type IV secretion system protein VirB6